MEILLHVANFYSLHLNALRTLSGSLRYLYNVIYYLSLYSSQEHVTTITDPLLNPMTHKYKKGLIRLMETFYKVNVINNWAFSFKVPLTLHIVFRAGSLVTNLLLSRLILKRQFSKSKYISVATITLGILNSGIEFKSQLLNSGIIICTLVTTPKKQSDDNDSIASNSDIVQGLIVMTIGLILSSTQGILQERTRYKDTYTYIILSSY